MKLRHKIIAIAASLTLIGGGIAYDATVAPKENVASAEAFQDIIFDVNCPGNANGQQLNINNYSDNSIRVRYQIMSQSGKATTTFWRLFPGYDSYGAVPPKPNPNVWSPRVWWMPDMPYDYMRYWLEGTGTLDFNYKVWCH